MVRNIPRSIAKMGTAANEIAMGRFDVRIQESHTDQVGRLANTINSRQTESSVHRRYGLK